MAQRRVVVTGMGMVTSLGQGKADNWSALTAGRSGPVSHDPRRSALQHGQAS
jgi:3-oxoacyl-(acyl-carrier-protein) synthase